NLTGAFIVAREASRFMIRQRSGSIINMASVIGLMGNAGQTNYAASKAGLIGFTKALAKETAKRGVRVNAIAPGFIKTDMTDKLKDDIKDAIKAQIPMDSLGEPEDVANGVIYLASDMARYVTGQVLTVDGGMVM
ncbi:MAG: SDR family oxidoreductase, partial [Spirochaetales bacterium]|nr:SDR family oxidoreductase [Spirochaetales bacterium]